MFHKYFFIYKGIFFLNLLWWSWHCLHRYMPVCLWLNRYFKKTNSITSKLCTLIMFFSFWWLFRPRPKSNWILKEILSVLDIVFYYGWSQTFFASSYFLVNVVPIFNFHRPKYIFFFNIRNVSNDLFMTFQTTLNILYKSNFKCQ